MARYYAAKRGVSSVSHAEKVKNQYSYRVPVLCDNHNFVTSDSYPVAHAAVSHRGYSNTISKPTGSDNQ
jgi:hypothetical protein